MNKKLSIAMAVALASASAVSVAEENMGLEFSANVTLASDYLWRGFSLSDNEPVIQGGFDASHSSGLYAGIWGSSIEQYAGAETEIDIYAGWAGDVGPVGVDVGVVRYMYPGEDAEPSVDTTELYAGVSGDLGPVGVGLTYYYSDEFFGSDDSADRWELSGEYAIKSVTLSAAYGWNDVDADQSYDDWSIGASTELGGFEFGLTYMDSDYSPSSDTSEDLWAFSISKSL